MISSYGFSFITILLLENEDQLYSINGEIHLPKQSSRMNVKELNELALINYAR